MTPQGQKKISTRTLLILLAILIIGFPIAKFVFVNLQAGYNEAERQNATRPTTANSNVDFAKPMASADALKLLDFSPNIVDVHNHTDHYTEKLPPITGSARNSSISGMVNQGNFEILGTLESLTGATRITLPSSSHAGGLVTVQLTVTQGAVRAYLSGLNGSLISGYVFVDVSPSHPGQITGYLDDQSDTGTLEQIFVLESRNGPASGISFRVIRP